MFERFFKAIDKLGTKKQLLFEFLVAGVLACVSLAAPELIREYLSQNALILIALLTPVIYVFYELLSPEGKKFYDELTKK